METYQQDLAPEGESIHTPKNKLQPEMPSPSNNGGGGDMRRMTCIIVSVAVGLVALGVGGGLVYIFNQPKCDDTRFNSLVEQAKNDKSALKEKINRLESELQAVRQMPAPDSNDAESEPKQDSLMTADFTDSDWQLFTHREYGLALAAPDSAESSVATCKTDEAGERSLGSGSVPVIAINDSENDMLYVTRQYHYDSSADPFGECRRIDHDLEMFQSGSDLPRHVSISVAENIISEEEMTEYVYEKLGEKCEITEGEVLSGTVEDPNLVDVGIARGAEPEDDCFLNYSFRLLHNPNSGRAYLVLLGQDPVFGAEQTERLVNSIQAY